MRYITANKRSVVVPIEIEEQPSGNRVTGELESGSTSDTESFTTDSGGGNRLLIVETMGNGFANNITYNGVALTMQVNHDDGTFGCEIWYLINPPTGAHDIVVTGDSDEVIGYGVTVFWYVDQATPVTNNTVNDGFASSHTTTINPVAVEDMLLVCSLCETSTTGGGGSQIEFITITPGGDFADGSYKLGGGGSTSITYTHATDFWVYVGTKMNFSAP